MVGNDIIDIAETRRSNNWERPGFLLKVFSPKEQELISDSSNPFATVWRLWSMKESAYKVFIQAGGERFFNPAKIECTLDSLEKGRVDIGEMAIQTKTSINPDYIFTSASMSGLDFENQIFQLTARDHAFQSKFMKKKVLNAFAESKGLDADTLEIHKTHSGVPKLHYRNEAINCSLSITHHGLYGAYSILKD